MTHRAQFASYLLIGFLIVCFSACRTPWQTSMSPEPDFDRLIQIEQRGANPASKSPLARRLRPDSRSSKPSSRTSSDNPAPEDILKNDAEYQEAYADASEVERALLDRFGKALLNTGDEPQPADRSKPSRSAVAENATSESTASDKFAAKDGNDPVVYSLSDASTEDVPKPSQSAPTQLAANRTPNAPKSTPPTKSAAAETPTALIGATETSDESSAVQMASFENAPIATGGTAADELEHADLRTLAHALIAKLDENSASINNPDEQIDLAKKRRLINLVIDDLDAAQEPIDGLQSEAQQYIQHTFQGLHDATDITGNPVASRRLTLALQSHRRGAENLSQLANLEVLNLSFCTEVDSFGVTTKFPQYNFRPDQEVLLYCELENFVSEQVRGGFETQLQGSYEIIDSDGRRVADQLLPEDTDTCGRRRRDFYIAYRLHMPANIEPGRYHLKLTVEDMKGHKFGQSQIDLQIVR